MTARDRTGVRPPRMTGSIHGLTTANRQLAKARLFDATTIVAGSMIGSGIFIVSAEAARYVPSPLALLLVWLLTLAITVAGAWSYGRLAMAFPKAGGQYVYLREAWGDLGGFLYGWAVLLVIQTGTIAAVAVAFGKYLGVLLPAVHNEPWVPARFPASSLPSSSWAWPSLRSSPGGTRRACVGGRWCRTSSPWPRPWPSPA